MSFSTTFNKLKTSVWRLIQIMHIQMIITEKGEYHANKEIF